MNEYTMMGHIYKKVPKNMEWLKEGCICAEVPDYIMNTTFEDLEKE